MPTKILVVDDDPISLRVTAARLRNAGFEVVTREESIGTSECIRHELPDIVMLDVRMPGLSGDRLAALLNERSNKAIPVILHSSEDPTVLRQMVRACNAIGWIGKTDNDALFATQFLRLADRARRAEPPPEDGET